MICFDGWYTKRKCAIEQAEYYEKEGAFILGVVQRHPTRLWGIIYKRDEPLFPNHA